MGGLHSPPVGLLATGRSAGFDPLKALAHIAGGELEEWGKQPWHGTLQGQQRGREGGAGRKSKLPGPEKDDCLQPHPRAPRSQTEKSLHILHKRPCAGQSLRTSQLSRWTLGSGEAPGELESLEGEGHPSFPVNSCHDNVRGSHF